MMHGYGFGSFGSFGWIGMILNLVVTVGIVIGVIWLVVWLVKRATPANQGPAAPFGQPGTGPSPREILQARYARGEITREQYLEILADLA